MKTSRIHPLVCAAVAACFGISSSASAAIWTIGAAGNYATVGAAVANAGTNNGDTLNFIDATVTEAGAITLSKSFTINLAGGTWQGAGTNPFSITTTTTVNGGGGIMRGGTNNLIVGNGDLTLDNVIVDGVGTAQRAINLNAFTLTVQNDCIIRNAVQIGVRLNNGNAVANISNSTIQGNATAAYVVGSGQGQIVLNALAPTGTATLTNVTIDRGVSTAPAINVGNAAVANTLTMTGGSIINGSASTAVAIIKARADAAAEGDGAAITLDGVTVSNVGTGDTVLLGGAASFIGKNSSIPLSGTADNNGNAIDAIAASNTATVRSFHLHADRRRQRRHLCAGDIPRRCGQRHPHGVRPARAQRRPAHLRVLGRHGQRHQLHGRGGRRRECRGIHRHHQRDLHRLQLQVERRLAD